MTPLHALLFSIISVFLLCAGMFLCYYVTTCLMRRNDTTGGRNISITLPSESISQSWLEMEPLAAEERS